MGVRQVMFTLRSVPNMTNEDTALKRLVITDEICQLAVIRFDRFLEDLASSSFKAGDAPAMGIILTAVAETTKGK
jgi:hypothetical protein